MDDDGRQSADDALEPQDDIFSPTRDQEKLAEDNDPPTAPAGDTPSSLPPDHPASDSGIDTDELYHEGTGEATNTAGAGSNPPEEPRPLEPN